jgi:signal transduction histidine kinase
MSRAAGQMAAGDFETRVPERGAAEVSQLGAALNRMSASLRDTIHSLTEERSKLDHIVTTMGEGVIAVDRSRRVLMANPQAEALLSRDGMARIGQQLPEGPLAAAFHHVMGESREQTIALTASNGRTLQAHISPTAVEGSTIGAVGVVQDVTELHRVERMRRQFVADASHQLRSPLTAMQGHAEALLDEVASDEATRRRYLAAIVRDSRRLNRLIEQLLDLSQLESGHARLTLRPLTVPALVNRIVGSIDTLEQQPKVIVHIATDLPPALADESYTEQALLNLLANALHYTPPEGRVTVWARPEAGAIRVGVTDTGKGIAPEHLPHIWERFYRAEESGRDGTGLGLAIVKSLVERQGGQVSAESRLGAGSTFSFTLPPAPQQDPSYSLDPPLTLP